MKSLLLIATVAIALSGCAKFESHPGLANSNRPPVGRLDDESENIADEGEALLVPQTLEQAREKFRLAVEHNSENARALFWLDVVDVLLEFKGIVARVQPLFASTDEGASRYAALRRSLGPRYSEAQARYLLSGREDIRTPEEASEFLDRMRLRVYKLRTTIRKIQDTEITVTLPKELIGERSAQTKTACGIVNFGPIQFRFDDQVCSGNTSVPFGVNRADFNAILQMLSYYQVMLDFWTAYKINPVAYMNTSYEKVVTKADAEKKVRALFSEKLDGSLSRPQPFIGLKEMAADTFQALRYESEHQKELCPAGYSSPNNRKGYLLSTGSCITVMSGRSNNQRTMDVLESFLAGQPAQTKEGDIIHLDSLINDPPKTLKEFFPLRFDDCGQITSFNIRPLQKVYPSLRAETLFRSQKACPTAALRGAW